MNAIEVVQNNSPCGKIIILSLFLVTRCRVSIPDFFLFELLCFGPYGKGRGKFMLNNF